MLVFTSGYCQVPLLEAFVWLFLSAWLAIHASAPQQHQAWPWRLGATVYPRSQLIHSPYGSSLSCCDLLFGKLLAASAEAADPICSSACTQH